MFPEILPAGFRCLHALNSSIRIIDNFPLTDHSINIGSGLGNVALDIHSKARSLWDSKTEVKSHTTRDTAKANEDAPHVINMGRVHGI
jgi:hypothetical protein